MPKNKEALKATLMSEAEAAISAMLNDSRMSATMTLSEMEAVVGKLGAQLLQGIMQRLVDETAESKAVKFCDECGGELRYKGQKAKQDVTLRGEVQLQRDYYVCNTCGRGVFPPG